MIQLYLPKAGKACLYCGSFTIALGFFLLISFFASCNKTPDYDNNDDKSYFATQVEKAEIIVDAGDPSKAFRFIDSALAAQKPATTKDKFKYYKFYCGYYYQEAKDYDRATLYADSLALILENSEKVGNYTRELAEVKYSKGDILFGQQKYSEAYQNYFSAKLIGKNSVDPCNLSDYSYRMGMILYKQSRFKAASGYFIQSYKETETCADNFTFFYRRQELLNNTALSYHKAGHLDSSLVYYKKALRYIESTGGKYPGKVNYTEIAKGVVYGNQAQIFKAKGNYQQAEKLFVKSININLKKGYDNNDAQLSQLQLAELYFDQGRIGEMLNLLKQVKASMVLHPSENALLEWNRLMWKYHQYVKEPENAFNYLLAYTSIKESIVSRVKGLTESDVDEHLKNLEDQYENTVLKKGSEMNALYLKIAIAAAIFSVIIILLVLKNWHSSTNNVRSLTNLNNQISEQKKQMELALKELEERGKEKDRILRAVAHDLRNPIGGVASLSGVVLEEHGLSDDQKEMISLIQSTCLDALQLINEILELAVVDSINDMPKEKVEINTLLANAIELLRFKAEEKNQTLLMEGLGEPQKILMNREKIGRVVSNLISNAIKFSPSGAEIKVMALNTSDAVQIAVVDKGIGIPDSIKHKIFDTFTDAKRLGTSGEKPFGLGLSISKQIIEVHNGKIWFESEAGKGSTFYIELKKAAEEIYTNETILTQGV